VKAALDFYFADAPSKARWPVLIDRFERRSAGGVLVGISPDGAEARRTGRQVTFSALWEVCVEPSGSVHAITWTHAVAMDSLGCR
jgi:hypothetical protein